MSAAERKVRSGLWGYNVRIMVGNTYWLVVTPVAATQLVLFWNMATATLYSASRAAQTIEVLAAILGAFLCAHALAPEQDGVGELVFVRPLSLERVLALRMAVIFGFVFAVMLPAFIIYATGIDDFPLGLALLAAVPSMLFLSVLAMGLASAARHPFIGLAGAGLFWALDLTVGSYFNPLVSLHGFGDYVGARPMAEQWWVSKAVLLVLSAVVYGWMRRGLGRPAGPRRWVAVVRNAAVVFALVVVYVASGAAYKVSYGIRHERELGHRTRLWYQQQFRGYGPIPVAWMMGPAFPMYVQAELGRDLPLAAAGPDASWTPVEVSRMKALVARYPDSIWADNAQFEIARYWSRRSTGAEWVVIGLQAGTAKSKVVRVQADIERAAEEFERLADEYPGSPFAPLALSERALIGLQLLDYGMAVESYERLIAEHPGDESAYEAGARLAAYYEREGRAEEALRAAEVAAGAAPWELRAEPLLAGARAAEQCGKEALARERYEQAREAAREAVERATRGERRPTGLAKDELFVRSNAVIAACEAALSGGGAPAPWGSAKGEGEVSGRIVREGLGIMGIRVALGRAAGGNGLPSPFGEGPAVTGTTGGGGVFRLAPVRAGEYGAAGFAMRVGLDEPDYVVTGVELPVEVGEGRVALPPLEVRVKEAVDAEARVEARPGAVQGRRPLRGSREGPRPGERSGVQRGRR